MDKERIASLIVGGMMTLGGAAGTCGTIVWMMHEEIYNPFFVPVVGLPALLTLAGVEELALGLFEDTKDQDENTKIDKPKRLVKTKRK